MDYIYRVNKRAKRMHVKVYEDGRIVVTTPRIVRKEIVERFLKLEKEWIEESQRKMQEKANKRGNKGLPYLRKTHTKAEVKKYTEEARALAASRLAHFNQHYHFSYNDISIRNQKTRWGSCSASRNLSFNYRIACIPAHLADYVVVHELCHIKEMNHSPRFWKLVEKTIPDYAARRKALRAL